MAEASVGGDAVTRFATLVRAPNPGPMTLDGTNSYVLRAPGSAGVIVVDPGPSDAAHLRRLAEAGRVELVLLTHHHVDHSEALAEFASLADAPARLTHHHVDHSEALAEFASLADAPARAIDPAFCIGAEPLVDSERIEAAGLALHVIATPGHTADSVCFVLPDDGAHGSVLTGDTVLGRGTTIIADPDGALGPYLHSLGRLRALGAIGGVTVLPGHGPVLPDLAQICDAYLAHRSERLDQIRAALGRLGADASAEAVTDLVYADTDASVRGAAEASVRAQLRYLRGTATA